MADRGEAIGKSNALSNEPIVVDIEIVYVSEVTGDSKAFSGEEKEYSVSQYSSERVNDNDRKTVKWAVKTGDEITKSYPQGEKLSLEIKKEWVGKEIIVMPYRVEPVEQVSVKTKIGKTVVLSPGHGLSTTKVEKGNTIRIDSTGKRREINGMLETDHIYNLQRHLIPALENAEYKVINIKAPPYNAYEVNQKVDVSNDINNKTGVDLHIAVHADARGKNGETGVHMYYTNGKVLSKKYADIYVKHLKGAGIIAKSIDDTKSYFGSLGELRRTKAKAVYIEMGNQESKIDFDKLRDPTYLKKMANAIANATKEMLG